jgi:translation initiation factor IF-2
LEDEKLKELKIILKGDSKGSVEALKDMLNKISNEEVKVNIIHSSPGAVTEGDIKLAGASDAIVIAFNVRPTTKARYEAEKENIEIRTYNVVYHVTKDIEEAVKGMLSPIFKEVYQGRAEIRKIFKMTKIGNIGGSFVIDGRIKKNSQIRVLRNGIIIHEGELNSLKRYNDDANEVIVGLECGITIDNYNDIKEGDIIESFIMEEIER